MKICSVIVTYGDRFHLLKQVIDACLREGIDKIIVVDNASVENSRKQLQELENKLDKLEVIYFDENRGSAGGYKAGLKKAYECEECEYILCLDDDNILPLRLKRKLNNIVNYIHDYKHNVMLSCYRMIFEADRFARVYGYHKDIFSMDYLGKIKIFIMKKFKEKFNYPLVPIKMSSMGGLFFSKKVIEIIGYPNEKFYLYIDDLEYTYRFYKQNGNIFLCTEIVITDIDKTYADGLFPFSKNFPNLKLYYGVRNSVYFLKKNTNLIYFAINFLIIIILPIRFITKTSLINFIKKYVLYLKAIKDGLFNKMGKIG